MSTATADRGQLTDFEAHVPAVAPHEAAEHVAFSFVESRLIGDATQRYPVNLIGMPGIGKTSAVRSLGAAVNAQMPPGLTEQCGPFTVGVLNAKQLYKSDLVGVPVPNEAKTQTRLLSPELFPSRPDGFGLVLIDEINPEDPDVRQTATELAFSGIHGQNTLAPGYQPVGAMNPAIPSLQLNRSYMGIEEANRFTHVLVCSGADEFLGYMTTRDRDGADPRFADAARMMVYGITEHCGTVEKPPMNPVLHTYLSKMQPQAVNDPWGRPASGPVPTPRTWEHVNQTLAVGERLVQDGVLSREHAEGLMQRHIQGTVGIGPGTQFWAFREIAGELAFARDVIDGTMSIETARDRLGGAGDRQMDRQYAFATNLVEDVFRRAKQDALAPQHAERALLGTGLLDRDIQAMVITSATLHADCYVQDLEEAERTTVRERVVSGILLGGGRSSDPAVREVLAANRQTLFAH